ncbi:unnamed protein product [Boreogadus saida]
MEEKGIGARDCLPPKPRCRAAAVDSRGGGAPALVSPGSSMSRFNLDFQGVKAKVPLPQFLLLNHGRDNHHYESRCGSTGSLQTATSPFSSASPAAQSVLQIDVELEEPQMLGNPAQSFEIHNIIQSPGYRVTPSVYTVGSSFSTHWLLQPTLYPLCKRVQDICTAAVACPHIRALYVCTGVDVEGCSSGAFCVAVAGVRFGVRTQHTSAQQ